MVDLTKLLTLATGGVIAIATGASAQVPPRLEGTLLVLNKAQATVTFVDLASGSEVASLPTGAGPHELVISTDGRWAVGTDYGAGSGGNTLTIIDVEGVRIARTVDLGQYTRPHGISFLPGGEVLAVTSESTQSVILVRMEDGEIVGTVSTGQRGSHMLAVVADGRRIYTSNGQSNSVSELDMDRGEAVRTFAVPPSPEAITVTPDGSEVWVGSNDEGTLNLVHTADGTVETVADGFGWPYRILITPDQRRVIVPDLEGNVLRIFDRTSREELSRIDFPAAGPEGVTLYRDPNILFLALSQQGRVAVIDIQDGRVLGYYATGDTPDGIAYSPVVLARQVH